ncbi:hypothetical protein [Bacillus piscicola]|uniref:hypothetical protein n=1 Tax=Bacillus piscicola TaxID=1632684 RepID=UPI001F095023|nr:hypothetical protein [Bacillus piscicola]
MKPGNEKGYGKGVGRTFTPSRKADWVDHFNRILKQEPGWSRNSLTEHLLRWALSMRQPDSSTITIRHDGLSQEQIQYLRSEQGRDYIDGIVKFAFWQQTHFAEPATPPSRTGEQEAPTQESENFRTNDYITKENEKSNKEIKLSAIERAQRKLNRQENV